MIRILEIDGGGVKGMIPVMVLRKLEKELGKPIYELFDLIVGTSAGAIIGGILATGKMTATELADLMEAVIPQMFGWRFRVPVFQPKYSRKPFCEAFDHYVGKHYDGAVHMSDCKVKFMCTSVSKVDGRTHFFKSWEDVDGLLDLLEAINRSYAAPLFFGSIVRKEEKQVWLDGGVGNRNCPLLETMVEALRQDWLGKEQVHILSLGTGYAAHGVPYRAATRWGNIGDILFFADPSDGGLARNQSRNTKVKLAEVASEKTQAFTFNRVDDIIDKKMDKLDKVKYLEEYKKIGKDIFDQVQLQHFRG